MIPTRQEFMHIPEWEQHLFYILVYLSLAVAGIQLLSRARLWMQGKPIDWKPDFFGNIWRYAIGQKKVQGSRHKSGAPMHLLIFYGFLTLFIGTTILAINTYSPWKFYYGLFYLIYKITLDTMGIIFMIGVSWAILRRFFYKPKAMSHSWTDLGVLVLLLILGATGYLLEGARISNHPEPFNWCSPIGQVASSILGNITNSQYRFIWWFHAFWVFLFFMTLPQMRIRHIVLAIFSTGGSQNLAFGELKPLSLAEVEETGQIGVEKAKEYSKWHLMSLDACMECGRCTEVCPANGTGKVLNPKQVVLDLRGAMSTGQTVAQSVSEEALWACTTCNACVEACPVLIRHVDMIVDARRNLVAEGKLSGSAATMLRQSASTGNPWNVPSLSREEWMKGLEVPLAREKKEFEVLFWVGCAGATDPGAINTTKSVAYLLKKAGVDYACLGVEEQCTGDPARRIGDEFLFQEQAKGNIRSLDQYNIKKIVTPCPHCFNTFKNEYHQLEGHYEVYHHTQFLSELIRQGKLKSAHPEVGKVTYHDPCYLARINHESNAPRALLGERVEYDGEEADLVKWMTHSAPENKCVVEPTHFGKKTLCCGAGGGRMWMEESSAQRPAGKRIQELLATGATTIATGCPFCKIMLDTSLSENADRKVELLDVAQILEEANR